jgi:signal transduction histidine kinase
MNVLSSHDFLSEAGRPSVAEGLPGLILLCAGLTAGLVLAADGAWWAAAIMLALVALAWRLRGHALEGRRGARPAQAATVASAVAAPVASADAAPAEPAEPAEPADVRHPRDLPCEHCVLVETGAALTSGLGMETTLMEVARHALPVLGDVCLVDVMEGDRIRRVGTRHAERRSAALAEAVRAAGAADPLWPDVVMGRALAGETLVFGGSADAGPDAVVAAELRAAAAGVLTGYGCATAVVVPLRARDRTLGVLTFMRASGRARYDGIDLALVRDLADRTALVLDSARLLEDAETATRSKADFLAVMSHELRTPLTTITGYADLMLGGAAEPIPEKSATYVQRIRGAAWQLLCTIEQILTYARLDEAREQVDPARLPLADFVRDTAALMEPVAADKGVAFSAKAPRADVTLVTDASKLRQIVLNLLANAVRFTDGGVVSLAASIQDDMAVFEVRDTGVGIAPEHLERIFEPFWQVDQSSARRAGGTGIGLSVAQRMARLLGGTIEAASSPGEGTTFTLRIPAEWTGAAHRQAAPPARLAAGSVRS